VSITENGNQPGPARNLPATSGTAQATGPQPAGPDAMAPVPVYAGTQDLADDARRRRWQRQHRAQSIAAEYWLKTRVAHPDGGERAVEEILADEAEQRGQIEDETSRGSRKHQRLARWMRAIPKAVLVFDFCLLLYFFAGITDVNWASPLSVNLAFAAALDAMVTVLSYGFLAFTGHRMRSHKNHTGTVHLDELDGFTKAAFGIALAVITVIATLMFIRMHTEVVYALGPRAGVTALVIPLAVAVVSAVANYLVVAIHALDGSDQVARLDKLSAATRRPAGKAHRLRQRAARQANR
jgi:hypothetical protein